MGSLLPEEREIKPPRKEHQQPKSCPEQPQEAKPAPEMVPGSARGPGLRTSHGILDSKDPRISHGIIPDSKDPRISHATILDSKDPRISHGIIDSKDPRINSGILLDSKDPRKKPWNPRLSQITEAGKKLQGHGVQAVPNPTLSPAQSSGCHLQEFPGHLQGWGFQTSLGSSRA
ncbi:hypothetical protein HGM15179_016012 [Zosterops borbonicus]|uniref:Uncharacterized protein n=1 Tax=Zosterops borbonicus TaxID=364589 RepID=A0A8K1G3X1_9PASS|nr:hypothetical protein HGM15179_016012 [Zosterops borbonicus]